MSPSDLSWLQDCLFFFLGVAASYGLNRCQYRRNRHETSGVGPITVLIDSGITPTPIDDAEFSGDDEEARPPSNLSNSFGEAMASTWSLSCPDPDSLRSESLGHDPRSVSEPLGATMQTSHFLEFVAKTEVPNFDRRETAYSTNVADMTDYNQGTEYPSHQISVNIRLSGRRFIDANHLRIGLQREGLSCEVRGNVITVSDYPADDGVNGFLALVQQISGDRGASIVQEEEKKGNFGMKEKHE